MLEKHWGRMSLAVVAALFATACSSGDNAGGDTATDSGSVSAGNSAASADAVDPSMVMSFLHTVDQHEVEAGRVAQTKATNTQVRDYARMMVTDHCRSLTMAASASGSTTASGSTGAAGASGSSANAPSTAECDRAMGTSGNAASGNTASGNAASGNAASGTAAGASATTPAASGNAQGADMQQMQQMQQQAMSTLNSTPKGARFDSTYIASMVTGHQQVLQRLETMRGTGGSASGSASGATAGGANSGAGATATPGTGNAGAAGSSGTTQPAGTANQGDATQSHLQAAITMVRTHLERAQEIQRTLQSK